MRLKGFSGDDYDTVINKFDRWFDRNAVKIIHFEHKITGDIHRYHYITIVYEKKK